jgi:hypothetical protein
MKVVILPFQSKEHCFYIAPFSGKLYKVGQHAFIKQGVDEKLKIAIDATENPYSFETLKPEDNSKHFEEFKLKKLERFHNFLLKLGNKHFFLSRLYAGFCNIMFDNSVEAFDAISKLDKQIKNKNELCLQRSLLVMKTSKEFKNSGVLFIGASFPSGKMHAWIIENGKQPDRLDRNWIMYRPLLALYY